MIWRMVITNDKSLFFCSPHMMIWTPNDMMMMSLKRKMEGLIHFKRTWLSHYIMAKFHFSLWRRFCFRDKRFFFLFNTWQVGTHVTNHLSNLLPVILCSAVAVSDLRWSLSPGRNSVLYGMGLESSNSRDLYAICAENLREISVIDCRARWFFQ